jgi:hypothetical protein
VEAKKMKLGECGGQSESLHGYLHRWDNSNSHPDLYPDLHPFLYPVLHPCKRQGQELEKSSWPRMGTDSKNCFWNII